MKIKINSQGLRRSLRGFCALLVLAFLITCTGRGVDVGNPVQGFAIQGFVYTPDNNPARKAQVILGIARENELDTIFQEGACNNNCTQFVAYQYLLDTVQADDDGWFIFENKTPAEYVLVANSDSLSSYRRIEHKSQITDIDINLSPSHDITLGTGYFESEGKSLKFFVIQNTNAASFEPLTGLDMVMEDSSLDEFLLDFRIKGTSVRADEVNGLFTLNQAPQGVFDLVVFDTDSNRFEIPYNNNGFGCEIYLADEALVLDQENIEYPLSDYSGAIQLEKWVSSGCRLNDVAAQPEVIWSLPQNESQGVRARIDSKSGVQLSLQFSHPMQRENTSKFLNFIEPSSAGVQSVTWRGHDLVDVVFCENTSKGCMDFERFRVGQKYSLEILTGASSYFGMSLAEPDTIWFIPEPYPRVGVINGLGKSVLASHDDADISPEEVILGLDIHPSEAFAAGNSLMLFTNGPADVSSLGEGIKCFEGDVKINCLKSATDEGIQITFPDEFKAPENYRVTLETALSIEGHNWPKQQTISWYTVFYGK